VIAAVALAAFFSACLGALAVGLWFARRRELAWRMRSIAPAAPPGATPGDARSGGLFGALVRRLRHRAKGALAAEEAPFWVGGGKRNGAESLLSRAGYRSALAARAYAILCVALPPAAFAAAWAAAAGGGLDDRRVFVLAAAAGALGVLAPKVFLRARARRRQEELVDALPDALDLLTVCVEAGLGLNAAFVKIAEEFKAAGPVLSEEFGVVNREILAGKPRPEALRALAERTGAEEVRSFAAMLVQTDRLGTSLARSLRVHAESLRTRRRQRAEEAAARTTIKLVFPLVFLLFPALFIVVLGPAVLHVARVLFPAALGR